MSRERIGQSLSVNAELLILATMAIILVACSATGAHSVSRRTLWTAPMAMYPETAVGVLNGTTLAATAPTSIQAARARRVSTMAGVTNDGHGSTLAA